MYPVNETAWVGGEIQEALSRALHVRRHGQETRGAESLRDACHALGDRALARERGAEHVVKVFRMVWDMHLQLEHGDDPRSLLYYGALSQCLNEYQACAARAATSASRAKPASVTRALHTGENWHA